RGVTGISHVVEHMMFKGTKKHGKGEFSKTVAENGGQHNAFTDADYTGYYQVFAASRLKVSFEMEADRMQSLTLDPKEFEKEIQVVMEERRMRTDDNSHMTTYERFQAAAYVSNPYHQPVVGWMDDLQNMTIADVRAWYDNWYGPNNATVVVVGDVEPENVYALAKKYFGPIKPKKFSLLKKISSVKPLGERNIVVKVPAKIAWMIMGYNVPSLVTANDKMEPYALELIAGILDVGDSSRLAKELVRGQQIAVQTSVEYGIYNRFDTLLTISATPSAGHKTDEMRTALLAQITRLQNTPVSEDELSRTKAKVIANRIFANDSMEQQAMDIGSLVSVGLPWQTNDQYIENIETITSQQIQQVAKKYLNADRLTVAVLDPQPIDPAKDSPKSQTGDHHGH
ncbi:MAG: insulinase family protein, partial [Coxiellaceae bacterium]|nr:insulinase family protein [Coxiellaceae bacterium]